MNNLKQPAFPYIEYDKAVVCASGFTQLEYASLLAMQGILSNAFMMQAIGDKAIQDGETDAFKSVSKTAVAYAKLTIEEANK